MKFTPPAVTAYKRFSLQPKPRKLNWFSPVPKALRFSIKRLEPEQEYAFSRFFPDNGGFRTITASGRDLQRSWRSCIKRNRLDRFIAAFHPRPSHRCNWCNDPTGRWREVILYPRKDLSFWVQPVSRRFNGPNHS